MQTTVDTQDLVSWVVKGLAAVVMFLLALGAKEIRDRIISAENKAQGCLDELNDLKARIRFLEAVYEREK